MVDEDFIRKTYGPSEQASIADAMKILHDLNVFPLQAAENEQRVVTGFTNKNPTQLAEEILQVQQTNRQLLALHEIAGKFKEGMNRES